MKCSTPNCEGIATEALMVNNLPVCSSCYCGIKDPSCELCNSKDDVRPIEDKDGKTHFCCEWCRMKAE